ncbi:MerR family transcriptional regulator [Dehalogenimonas sp. 4OHTPN]|uniref:MerR family transcriptional regulator n=1 Tax=Dehalogenimonas sp. 4OHTPN TaxID=3166643 RepID=A0AAU8GBN1_9CHLR
MNGESDKPGVIFQIGDVAKDVGVSLRTVRYYEEEGLLQPTAVTPSGLRLYDNRAVVRLRFINTLRRLDMSIDNIKAVLGLNVPAPGTKAEILERSLNALKLANNKIDEQQSILSDLKEHNTTAFESVLACLKCDRPSCQDCPQCVYIL